jgi:homocysteine S-methyltransferase
VTPLVRAAVAASGKPAVAYPNSGETWDVAARTWAGDARTTAGVDPATAREWVAAGARYVGGCCRVGSQDIARLAAGLSAQPA